MNQISTTIPKEMELADIRDKLDSIDEKIICLLAERMEYIPHVAEYKLKHNLPRMQEEREQHIIEARTKQAEEYGLNPELAKEAMQIIIKYAHLIEMECGLR